MNKLSKEAKEQFIKGLVFEEGELMSFGNESLMRKELSYKERVDLYEIILERGVILYGEGQEILAKGTLAEKSELMNGGHDPISAHSDYQWFGSATQCCKCYNSTCIGTKRNCQC